MLPGSEPPTRYTYDPRDPVPSIGGNANHRGINRTADFVGVYDSSPRTWLLVE